MAKLIKSLFYGLSWLLLSALTLTSSATQAQQTSIQPTLTVEVTNTAPDSLTANQIFIRDVVLMFHNIVGSHETKTYQFRMVQGGLRGFVFFYIKDKAAAVRLGFDGNAIKVQHIGQLLDIDLSGPGCSLIDNSPTCTLSGTSNTTIKATVKYLPPK